MCKKVSIKVSFYLCRLFGDALFGGGLEVVDGERRIGRGGLGEEDWERWIGRGVLRNLAIIFDYDFNHS